MVQLQCRRLQVRRGWDTFVTFKQALTQRFVSQCSHINSLAEQAITHLNEGLRRYASMKVDNKRRETIPSCLSQSTAVRLAGYSPSKSKILASWDLPRLPNGNSNFSVLLQRHPCHADITHWDYYIQPCNKTALRWRMRWKMFVIGMYRIFDSYSLRCRIVVRIVYSYSAE